MSRWSVVQVGMRVHATSESNSIIRTFRWCTLVTEILVHMFAFLNGFDRVPTRWEWTHQLMSNHNVLQHLWA